MVKSVLFVGAEAAPFASAGGLGDVMGSLPQALYKAGNGEIDVRAVMPMYCQIGEEWRAKMKKVCEFYVPLAWRSQYCGVWTLKYKNVTYYFIDNEYYFKRRALYGEFDDGERFAFFSRAVVDMLSYIGFAPDILHCNDWQSAMASVYLRTKYSYPYTRTVYTIHNIEYQGIFGFEILGDVFDLGPEHKALVEYDSDINLTKAAIATADAVTTVSPRYASEIKSHYFACGLQDAVNAYAWKVSGIINGIDTNLYNPATDKGILANFTKTKLAGKAECKADLQRLFGLPEDPNVPLVAMVSRLASHKGFDLVTRVLEEFLQDNVQFVLLGTGDYRTEDYFRYISGRYPHKAGIMLTYNRDLSKKVYAGADLFLMPSRSEPCGLSQMIASRYGAIPVVHEVGGLYDTIKPFDETKGEGNGVTFKSYNAYDMLDALRRACRIYCDPEKRTKVIRNAMSMDFSWEASAKKYLDLYEEIAQRKY